MGEDRMDEERADEMPHFGGKVVAFYCGPNPQYSTVILSPAFETQCGRLFVVGASASRTPGRWDDGLHSAVAWEDVSSYNVFDSLSDYEERMSQPEYTKPRKPTNWLSRVWRT